MALRKPSNSSLFAKLMSKFIIEECNSEVRIRAFLSSVDREFTPPLSQKVSVRDYSRKLATTASNIFLSSDGYDVGHAAYYSNDYEGKIAFLTSICVVPDVRGSGLAGTLLKEVVQGATQDGMKWLKLEVNPKNDGAVRFYNKYGFIDCGIEQMILSLSEV